MRNEEKKRNETKRRGLRMSERNIDENRKIVKMK